jgi:predicted aspartyl protease
MTSPAAFWMAVALASWLVTGAAFIAMAADRRNRTARLTQAFERGTAHGRLLQMSAESKARQRAAIDGHRRVAEAREGRSIEALIDGNASAEGRQTAQKEARHVE